MSLLGRFNDLISGQPQGTSDAEAARSAAADATIKQDQAQTVDQLATSGQYTPDQLATIQAQMAQDDSTMPTETVASQAAQITGGFVSGAATAAENPAQVLSTGLAWEGKTAGNALSTVSSGLGSGLKSILGGVPVWMWFVGGVALFIWLGGGGFLERKARAKLST